MDFPEKLLTSFRQEAGDLVSSLNYNLIRLEQDPVNPGLINEIFRLAHSIKSSSGLMGFEKLGSITHKIEDMFGLIRNGKFAADKPLITLLLEGSDLLDILLENYTDRKEPDIGMTDAYEEKLLKVLLPFGPLPSTKTASIPSGPRATEAKVILTEAEADTVVHEIRTGNRVWYITLILARTVELKYARVYLTFSNLQSKGRVIKTLPDINQEADDALFEISQFIFSTKMEESELREFIKDDEIESIVVKPWSQAEGAARPDIKPVKIETGIKMETAEVENIVRLLGELILTRNELNTLKPAVRDNLPDTALYSRLNESLFKLEGLSDRLQNEFLKVRMVPVINLFRPFFKYVRDMASSLGKDTELEIYGGDTPIDRTLLDLLLNPLTYIVRNSISHGIEEKSERRAMGKSEKGRLVLSAYLSGQNVVIETEDDGRGLEREKIRMLGVEKKLIPPDAKPDDTALFNLISTPGFSTDSLISGLSGRGTGMDAVRRTIEGMQGSVDFQSVEGKGTKFRITIPVSLSVTNALLVRTGESVIGIPVNFITKTFLVKAKDISDTAPEYGDIPLVFLSELWEKKKEIPESGLLQGIELTFRKNSIGLLVSTILEEQELVMKDLDPLFKTNSHIAGASILGDGGIVFILNVLNLFKGKN
jgi:two-component system, chemotaxis family, sensor kinase CheA